MIRPEYEKVSTNIKDLIGEIHGKEIVETMEKISKIVEESNLNGITFLSDPATFNVLVAVQFAKILSIDISTGKPKIDLDGWETLSDQQRFQCIEHILKNIVSLLDSIDKINQRLVGLEKDLLSEQEILEAKLGKAN